MRRSGDEDFSPVGALSDEEPDRKKHQQNQPTTEVKIEVKIDDDDVEHDEQIKERGQKSHAAGLAAAAGLPADQSQLPLS